MSDLLEMIHGIGVVPVIKVDHGDDAPPLCSALLAGGLPLAEITFRTAAAEDAIRKTVAQVPDMVVGAGTVITVDQAAKAQRAGAAFIVTPGFNPKVVEWCLEHDMAVLPGCTTASEIELAMEMGLQVVKFFPAEQSGGLAKIKALGGPYGAMRFIPTGGIDLSNLSTYLACPSVLACGGSFMVKDAYIADKNWKAVTTVTRQAMEKVLGLELGHVGLYAQNSDDADRVGASFASLLGLPITDVGASLFAGKGVEIMKTSKDWKGHIGYAVNSVDRAYYQLKRKGCTFDEATTKRDAAGRRTLVYFAGDIGGFGIHLVQK